MLKLTATATAALIGTAGILAACVAAEPPPALEVDAGGVDAFVPADAAAPLDGAQQADGGALVDGAQPDSSAPVDGAAPCDIGNLALVPTACPGDPAALFVSETALDAGATGSRSKPYRSMQAAVLAAATPGKSRVYVCGSNHSSFVVAAGQQLQVFGGFRCDTWAPSNFKSKVEAAAGSYAMDVLAGANVEIANMQFSAPDGTAAYPNSITVRVRNATLAFANSGFAPGKGLAGTRGDSPAAVVTPVASNGNAATATTGGALKICVCLPNTTTTGGAGGNQSLSGLLGSGGFPNITPNPLGSNGNAGFIAVCDSGGNGVRGATPMLPGSAGNGAAKLGVLSASGEWLPEAGGGGGVGGFGQGGGGGAGKTMGGGGSGGCGGCGGLGGSGGKGGGASAAILSISSDLALVDCVGSFAQAGAGGKGGAPGAGGAGGGGGVKFSDGCFGGDGGAGALGGLGGGGAGGVAVGVMYTGNAPQLTRTAFAPLGGVVAAPGGDPGAPIQIGSVGIRGVIGEQFKID